MVLAASYLLAETIALGVSFNFFGYKTFTSASTTNNPIGSEYPATFNLSISLQIFYVFFENFECKTEEINNIAPNPLVAPSNREAILTFGLK